VPEEESLREGAGYALPTDGESEGYQITSAKRAGRVLDVDFKDDGIGCSGQVAHG
jgi:hypothetical protein